MTKLRNLQEGDTVIIDNGFQCMKAGKQVVERSNCGLLYVRCEQGKHYLTGQVGDNEELIGIVKLEQMLDPLSATK